MFKMTTMRNFITNSKNIENTIGNNKKFKIFLHHGLLQYHLWYWAICSFIIIIGFKALLKEVVNGIIEDPSYPIGFYVKLNSI